MSAITPGPPRNIRYKADRITTFPTATRHEDERRQRDQVSYLLWRTTIFLRDHGVEKDERRRYMDDLRARWARGERYEDMLSRIESIMNGFIQTAAQEIQSIYDER